MALESVTHIDDLNVSNPTTTDGLSQGDDHIRNIKIALTTDFPNVDSACTPSPTEFNILDGATVTTAELNTLDGFTGVVADLNYAETLNEVTDVNTNELEVITGKTLNIKDASGLKIADTAITSTAAEINILDGVTATTGEINTACDGITATAAEINTVCDGVLTGSVVWDISSTAGHGLATTTLTVTGAAVGDFVIFSYGVDLLGMIPSARVSSTNTVTLTAHNPTGGALNPASTTWKVKVLK